MQPSESSSTGRSGASGEPGAGWPAIALPLLVVLAAFLGGATQRWSEAIVLGGFALLLLARPPRTSLGPVLDTAALLFLACAAAAFLPARWFLLPAWRVALTNDFGVPLAATVSAQPWMTLDSLFLLLAGLAWVYYVVTLDVALRDIRMAARVFSGAIIALAALCLFLHFKNQALPFWHNERGFGPFPNRNQTGDLFGISTLIVLGCLQDDFRRGHKRWLVWLLGLGVLVAALILAFSRAGILILALLIFGGETIERFHLRLGSEGPVTADFRWLIFRDSWTMIQSSPWAGIGLGNFESVFALFRDVSRGVTRSFHPESDWLWVWAEMGWPALALLLVSALLFVRRAFPLKEGTNQRLRYTALVGALLFALHGFVDVSGHRFGSFLAGTLLLGLAQFRPTGRALSRVTPFLFRGVGLLLAVVSLAWFFSWRNALLIPGRVGVDNAREAATVALRGHRFAEAIALTDRALKWAPLDWQLYFLRARGRIGLRQPVASAVDDFRRARFLEPNAYQLPFEEGKAWLGWQPTLALTAWRAALQRQGAEEAGLYALMLTEASKADDRVHSGLREFAFDRPDLTIKYLEDATPAQFAVAVAEVRARDPVLAQFNPTQKERLFALWSNQEPREELVRAVGDHPEWAKFAWPGLARDRASRGEFAEAWQLVRQHAPAPVLPRAAGEPSVPDLQRELYANPGDYAVGYALYRAQLTAGRTEDALATVRHLTARSAAPPYFHYLEAEAWARQKNWERAWRAWQEYIAASGRRR